MFYFLYSDHTEEIHNRFDRVVADDFQGKNVTVTEEGTMWTLTQEELLTQVMYITLMHLSDERKFTLKKDRPTATMEKISHQLGHVDFDLSWSLWSKLKPGTSAGLPI